MIGLDDKRKVTDFLTVSMTGEQLLPQIINGGKAPRCHPSVNIPPGHYTFPISLVHQRNNARVYK